MINKDNSSIMVQKRTNKYQIFYDAKTKITSGKNIVSFDKLKEGSRVACRVDATDKAKLVAVRIDIRAGEE